MLVPIVVMLPMWSTPMGPVDDHALLPMRDYIDANGIAAALGHWMFESGARFRPLYWPLRIAELSAWGTWMPGWYLDRLLLAIATIVAGFALLRVRWPVVPSMFGAIVLIAGPQSAAFWMLGTQEAFAMPLALAGAALVGRRRFGWGLALTALSAYVKEPFIVTAGLTVAWAWWLGARRPALVAGAAVLVAAVAFAYVTVARPAFYPDGVPLTARYMYPAVVVLATLAAWLVARRRSLVLPIVALVGVGLSWGLLDAQAFSGQARDFAALVEQLRGTGRPVVVTLGPGHSEIGGAVRNILPGQWVPAPVPGCIEVAFGRAPAGVC